MLPRFRQLEKDIPHYVSIYEYYKHEIVTGNIPDNSRLPSIRKLADFLGLSTTPVEIAYNQLVAEGFIVSKPKSGFYVEKLEDIISFTVDEPLDTTSNLLPRNQHYEFDFHISKNDFSLFPFSEWRRVYNRSLISSEQNLLFYGDPQGEKGLREQISIYLRKYRGVICKPNQVVIGAEQHHLSALLAHILKQQSQSHIAVEDPGYLLIPETFKLNGYKVSPIRLEKDGISVTELYNSGARLAVVSPSHQFPKGMIMPIAKRLQLLKWAREVNGYIIEDDYDGEFRYHGKPIPSLQGLQQGNNVIYFGSFSQVLAPAICVAYMILPEELLPIFTGLKNTILFEQGSSRLHQHALQSFIAEGYLEKHIRRMRIIYRRKHDSLLFAIKKYFGEDAKVLGTDAGFHVLLIVNSPKTEDEMITLAKENGIRIASSSFTWINKDCYPGKEFIIGFAGMNENKMEEGIKLLAKLWLNA
ncbi:PLP-dependent aminotransferase family protein [Bacillus sp. FJAT-49736]|uniref:MocR-like pyridoxine biosynthesis transcription factor PdxR n=1 Tax=Bacillus sp. FJAT-49736 TaxID=2833582 RepID=UPI001BCA3464|nr:PLP-dependent aminotransferase family protein [Bacillus sp. FJAT-49736]MBS4174103.1 PLP-dependent aminotransferase family protein [Bacillus sp. FJAT-49736]